MLARNSLPLLYLDAPSLSFLVWLSPLSYLRLLRSLPAAQPQGSNSNPSIDIPVAHLTAALSGKYDGATIAHLKLVPSSEGVGTSPHSNFPNDHTFPQIPSHSWVLEFNRPSRSRHQPGNYGVVVSQSRLRAIQAVLAMDMSTDVLMNMSVPGGSTGAGLGNLGPFGSMGPVTGMNMGNLAFHGFMMGPSHAQSIDSGSWVDLLVSVVQAKLFLFLTQAHVPEVNFLTSVQPCTFVKWQLVTNDYLTTDPLSPDSLVTSCLTFIGDFADVALQS